MKKFLLFFILLFTMVLPAKVEAAFVEGLEDIPLADGLRQVDNGYLSFGNEEIRLVEVYLESSTIDFVKVARFYEETMPQMGWHSKKQSKNKLSFEREGESLEISVESSAPLVVRLTVKSKN